MAMVQPRNLKSRVWIARIFMWLFLLLSLFPFFMIISVSLRTGNFATGSLIPDNPTLDHWRLALGMAIENGDGTWTEPPFPVMTWLWNSIKVALGSSALILCLATTGAYAFAL